MKEHENSAPLSDRFLSYLEENTSGGYFFVRITPEGTVEQHHLFDNEMSYLAIIKKIECMLESMQELDSMILTNQMLKGLGHEMETEEDEDGEGTEEEEEERGW